MRLVIADDHPLFLEAAKLQIERARPDAEIVMAASLDEALQAARANGRIDALLLDLSMPGMNGAASLARVREQLPGVPLVVMSGTALPSDVAAVIRAGANGFLPKTLGPAVFVQALNVVLAGGTYLPADLLSALSASEPGASDLGGPDVGGPDVGASQDTSLAEALGSLPVLAAPAHDGPRQLTPRELQVLQAIVRGRSNKEIARELDLQEVTVKLHARRAYQKLGARNRAEATAIAIEQQIVQRGARP